MFVLRILWESIMRRCSINVGIKKLLSESDLRLINMVLNSNFWKVGHKLINKVNFAHNSVLEELAKLPLTSKYNPWITYLKTCEYSLSRELIYFMKVIYLKNYENNISKELK